ncbi:hypothetical protein Q5741_18745 [Paenibacillus sp. JX-17]|uniref:Uncharacterized protein n=2 Tax=Paenibacillus lacisoli TaxID=3064525 RepID=A0ABT9CLG5_9BACL|nr:hypothetical protein [Paenibacillus sp. JX-17]
MKIDTDDTIQVYEGHRLIWTCQANVLWYENSHRLSSLVIGDSLKIRGQKRCVIQVFEEGSGFEAAAKGFKALIVR